MITFKSYDYVTDNALLREMPLRLIDQVEIRATLGENPNEALCCAAKVSDFCELVFHDGELLAVYGVVGAPGAEYGIPWMVCTEHVYEHKTVLLRWTKTLIKQVRERGHRVLFNYVSAINIDCIEWLEWLGFTVDRATFMFFQDPNLPFHFFSWKKEDELCVSRH